MNLERFVKSVLRIMFIAAVVAAVLALEHVHS